MARLLEYKNTAKRGTACHQYASVVIGEADFGQAYLSVAAD
jgi:hypothetical protein